LRNGGAFCAEKYDPKQLTRRDRRSRAETRGGENRKRSTQWAGTGVGRTRDVKTRGRLTLREAKIMDTVKKKNWIKLKWES